MSFDNYNLARTLGLPENELTKNVFNLLYTFLLPILLSIVIQKIICASCFLWKCFLNRTTQFEDVSPILLYNSTIHGLSNDVFHTCCDHQGPTMTVFTLNSRIVVGMLFKSWNVSNFGWKIVPNMKLFLLNPDGSIVNLEPIYGERYKQYYNGFLSGPHFFGLPVDLRFSKTEVHFLQRKLITGNERCYYALINHIAVYGLGLKNFILPNSMKEQVFYSIIQSKLQKMNETSLLVSAIKRNHAIQALQKLKAGSIVQSRLHRIFERKRYQTLILKNAASLLVSAIKRNHDIQALEKLKAGSCIQTILLKIQSKNVVKKLIVFDKEIQVATCVCCMEPLVLCQPLKILPCGHVICGVCFPKISRLECPHCRKIFKSEQCKNAEQIVSHFSDPGIKLVFLS
jgi:hypothetical protein